MNSLEIRLNPENKNLFQSNVLYLVTCSILENVEILAQKH